MVVAGIGVCWFAGDVIWGEAIRDAENEGLVGVLIFDFVFGLVAGPKVRAKKKKKKKNESRGRVFRRSR